MAKKTKRAHKKHVSSKKLSAARHLAVARKVSSEKDLHYMIRMIGALFPLRQDKSTRHSLELLSDLSKKKGLKSFYGLLQGLLAENLSSSKLQDASDTVVSMFEDESGLDIVEHPASKHTKGKKGGISNLLHKL